MKHIKRLAAPKTWNTFRKQGVYIATPFPGKHRTEMGMAASVVLRHLIPLARNSTEVLRMLRNKSVLVDGSRITERKHSIGFMDVISIPESNEHYRILIDTNGRLAPIKITEKEASIKALKIINKRAHGKAGYTLGLSDGRNIITPSKDHKIGDTIIIEVPSQKIIAHEPLTKGTTIYLTGGKHVGEHGHIERVDGKDITYKPTKGESTTTLAEYALALGKTSPITLP
ncbi:hypothetical protein HY641_03795 [Candidatus Woesearchaeota archaeon]|nr:hypothetical protein [Candidatus Woesearchaeota archaeon]